MEDEAPPASSMRTEEEEEQDEAELRMRDIGRRFGTIPSDHEELLWLLEDAVFWLSKVDQYPSESMYDALRPTMDVLITNELLEHTDQNVKVAVTSCLTEVTRISVLKGMPYDDDVMKDVFKRIVETFGDLDDMDSPSFPMRVLILNTFSGIHGCVLMLDLALDHMILDMFRHFFETTSTMHSEKVTHYMENIMTVAIQESDDVHAELASCLLQKLTKEAQETLPASFGLAERVLSQCRDRLKPVLHELLKGTPLDDYSNVVTMLFRDALDAWKNNVGASGKDMAAEGKLSEKFSDESPQKTSKVDQNVNCLDQEGTSSSSTPTTAISSGAALVDSVKSPDGPDTSKQMQELTCGDVQTPDSSKQKKELTSGDEQILDSSKQKPELTFLDKQVKSSEQLISCDKEVGEQLTLETEKRSDVNSKKDHKLCSSIGSEMSEQSKAVQNNESLVASKLSLEINDGDKKQLSGRDNITAEESSKPMDAEPAVVKRKRDQPPATMTQEKKPIGKKHTPELKSAKLDPITDSGKRVTRQMSKDAAKSSSTKAAEGELGKKQHKTSMMQKEDDVSDKDTDDDISLKKMVSPTRIDKSKGQQVYSGASSKRRRLQEAHETPLSKKIKRLDENLIGSRIKVWWPEDKMFYPGVVESFQASSRKHKVSYDDGDVEVLVLKKERWEFIAEEQDTDPDASSHMRRGRKAKGSSGQQMKQEKTGTPQSDVKNPPKKRGRPNGVRSSNNMPNADSSVTPARLKGKGAEKDTQETPNKIGRNSKKHVVVKASSNNEPDSTSNSKDDASSEDKNSKDEVKSIEAIDGSTTNDLSTKRKPEENEGESSQEEKGSAKTTTRNKRRRKSCN